MSIFNCYIISKDCNVGQLIGMLHVFLPQKSYRCVFQYDILHFCVYAIFISVIFGSGG